MADFRRCAPQLAVVLASLVLWVSFAWGLPADAPAAEGEAEVAPVNPWAGVRISDAYDYAKCPYCRKKNEIRAERCSRCGYELPQPSGEVTDPGWVFVPGKGYYREGALLERGNTRKGMLIAGGVLMASGVVAFSVSWAERAAGEFIIIPLIMALVVAGLGAVLLIVGLSTRKKPVYAFECGELFEPYERPAFALRSADSEGAALKVEVTLLGF